MNRNLSFRKQTFGRRDEGFALIITITLLAFLVLLLISLALFTRIETRTADTTQSSLQARENALTAFNLAIGQLQYYAGQDRSVTARADIDPMIDPLNHNPYWTGVWGPPPGDPGGARDLLTWLVSGNEDPTNPLEFEPNVNYDRRQTTGGAPNWTYVPPSGTNKVRLVGPGSLEVDTENQTIRHAVVVPRVPIQVSGGAGGVLPWLSAGDHTIGHFAYWVGDQGVKAPVAKVERHLDVPFDDPTLTDAERRDRRQVLRQLIGQRFGQAHLFDEWVNIEFDPVVRERFRRVQSYNQLNLGRGLDNGNNIGFRYLGDSSLNAFKWLFHDVTHTNYGVLANSGNGGLKIDASTIASWAYDDFRDFPTNTLAGIANPIFQGVPPDLPGGGLRLTPVLTEFHVSYSVYSTALGGPVFIAAEAEIEIWNPYVFGLESADYAVRLVFADGDIDVWSENERQGRIHFLQSEADTFEFFVPPLSPGAIETISVTLGERPALERNGDPITIPVFTPDPEEPDAKQEMSLVRENPMRNFNLRFYIEMPDLENPSQISRYNLADFDDFDTDNYDADDNTAKFAFYVRMRDASDDDLWLTQWDPRAETLAMPSDPDDPDARNPLEINADVVDALAWGLNNRPGELLSDRHGNPVTLFEAPFQEMVSLGTLQHALVSNNFAYGIGNPWGGSANNVFDTHFLSTFPAWATAAILAGNPVVNDLFDLFPLPHTGMVPYRRDGRLPDLDDFLQDPPSDTNPNYPAEHLLLKGMFNINSTSIEAWMSVLSAINVVNNLNETDDTDWEFMGGAVPLENAHFRYSHSAHLGFVFNDDRTDRTPLQSSDVAYQQGVRQLRDIIEVQDLAIEIVDLIQREFQARNGLPFSSLREFVESGILQEAIDRTTAINQDERIPLHSPAYLTQADILTGLAPFILARSDTFLVRAYGDVVNPVTGVVEARAFCEAIVQRVPDIVDPDPNDPDDRIFNDAYGPGRRFDVIYFRWLDPSEV